MVHVQEEEVLQIAPTSIMSPAFGDTPPTEMFRQSVHVPTSAPSPDFVGLGTSNTVGGGPIEFQFMRGDPQPTAVPIASAQVPPPAFPSTFNSTGETPPIDNPKQSVPKGDGQYVPETGQQMDEKLDLVGNPVVGASSDKTSDQPGNEGRSYGNKPQGNNRVSVSH